MKTPGPSNTAATDSKAHRRGNLNVILNCDFCGFHLHAFKNRRFSLKFESKEELIKSCESLAVNPDCPPNSDHLMPLVSDADADKWNNEPRIQNFKITVDSTESYVDEVNIRKFLKCMAFMVRTFYNEEMRQLERKVTESLLLELSCFTLDTLHKFIDRKANQYQESMNHSSLFDKVFRYSVGNFKINLIDEKQPFLQIEIFGLEGLHRSHEKVHDSITVRIKDLKVTNLMPGTQEVDRHLVKFLPGQTVAGHHNFTFILEKVSVKGKIGENKWKYFKNVEVRAGALEMRISMIIFEKIYDFAFANQFQNPMLQDASDQKLDSELAEAFFFKPDEYLKKKDKIAKIKRKKQDAVDKDKNTEGGKRIPSVFKRFKLASLKVYLSYQAGIKLLVS